MQGIEDLKSRTGYKEVIRKIVQPGNLLGFLCQESQSSALVKTYNEIPKKPKLPGWSGSEGSY